MPSDRKPTYPESIVLGQEYFREYNSALILADCKLTANELASNLSLVRGLMLVEFIPDSFPDDEVDQLKKGLPGVTIREVMIFD